MSDLLNSASLVLIPSGYKEDTVYSVVPSDGAGDLSFTRASNGTRVNSAGLVEVVAWNLLEYSEDLTNAYWSKDPGVTIDSNVATAPNGTTTADRANYSGTGISFYRIETFIGANTFSVYLKGEGANIGKQIELEIGGVGQINVTLTGDWFRYEVNSSTTISSVAIKRRTSGQADAVLAWGIQVNSGSTAKPYFPTTDRLNVPRLTYQNGGGGCPSLLLEKQSTNLLTYSEQFNDASWSIGGASVTANNVTSPDGTQNADKLVENTTSTTTHYINKATSLTATSYTLSVFAKAAERKWIFLIAATSADLGAFFDLENGVVGTVSSGYTAAISNVGNGWYRCSITFTATATTWYSNFVTATANNTYNYSGTIGSGIYIWGAQLEASSYATSYIPTTSASATRVADACFKTGISSLIGQTEGVVFWDIEVETLSASGNENILNLDAGSYGNTLYFIKGAGGVLSAEIYVTGIAQCSFSYSLPSVGRYKMALAYKANDFAFYVNGVSRGTDSSGSVPAMSRFQLGNGVFGPSDGKTNQAILFPTRLTNAELASLTTI
jgi:hypothetical protein